MQAAALATSQINEIPFAHLRGMHKRSAWTPYSGTAQQAQLKEAFCLPASEQEDAKGSDQYG